MAKKFKLKAPEDRASKNINIRVTQAMHKDIEARAESRDLTISEYMIRCALGRPIRSNNANIIRKLSEGYRLMGELGRAGHLTQKQGEAFLQALIDAIQQIPLLFTNNKSDKPRDKD